MKNLISDSLTLPTQSIDGTLGQKLIVYRCYTCYNIDTGGETTPDTIDFFLAFMKISNYSTKDMAIHADSDQAKALQTPSPESPFQVGDSQLEKLILAWVFERILPDLLQNGWAYLLYYSWGFS